MKHLPIIIDGLPSTEIVKRYQQKYEEPIKIAKKIIPLPVVSSLKCDYCEELFVMTMKKRKYCVAHGIEAVNKL